MINIKKFLKDNTDFGYAEFSKKFISTKYTITGVRIPILKKFAKEIEPEYIDLTQTNLTHEEILLYIFCAGTYKTEAEQLEYLQDILPYIDNWCTADSVGVALNKLTTELSYNFLTNILESNNDFEIRVGLVCLMKHFLKTEKLDEILHRIREIKSNAYYVKMAISWFYAELCVSNSMKAIEEIKNSTDVFIRDKSISKINESYRIPINIKQEVSKLRIK